MVMVVCDGLTGTIALTQIRSDTEGRAYNEQIHVVGIDDLRVNAPHNVVVLCCPHDVLPPASAILTAQP